jgi:hypothetical protein
VHVASGRPWKLLSLGGHPDLGQATGRVGDRVGEAPVPGSGFVRLDPGGCLKPRCGPAYVFDVD